MLVVELEDGRSVEFPNAETYEKRDGMLHVSTKDIGGDTLASFNWGYVVLVHSGNVNLDNPHTN